MKKTHNCGNINPDNIGEQVCIAGWVNSYRDHGGLLFIDIRDRSGLVQTVFDPNKSSQLHGIAQTLKSEFVVCLKGRVRERPAGTENEKISTGKIEIEATELEICNSAHTPPFPISDNINVSDDLRLEYRYLDLRRPVMQQKFIKRHGVYQSIRKYLEKNGFLEIETPVLTKSTPEGARDYLVPSRVNEGKFYALPQSPQLFKQILMVAGYERYYQIARCFRDEDLRADRQPEFTQLDIEMSFVDEEDVMQITEGILRNVFKDVAGIELPLQFPRISHKEAMEKYGTDKPDTRFAMFLHTITDIVKGCEFRVFKDVIEKGGNIRVLCAPNWQPTRSEIDLLTQTAKGFGSAGLVWFKHTQQGIESPVAKFIGDEILKKIVSYTESRCGDTIFVMAGEEPDVSYWMGRLRVHIAEMLGIIPQDIFHPIWVTEFPMFFYNKEEKRWESEHHPFTSPKEEDISFLDVKPSNVRSRAYDLVLNGLELGGGSIRIHRRELQEKIFSIIGISNEDAMSRFGFLLNAFQYGAPPHGGIALGLDRLVRIITGDDNIRDVIAFPKTQKAACLMTSAPSNVAEKQLKELHLKTE